MRSRYRLKYRLFRPALIVLQIAEDVSVCRDPITMKPGGETRQIWRDATPEDFTSEFEL